MQGGLAPLGEYRETWVFQILKALAKKYNFSLSTPLDKFPEEILEIILNGSQDIITVPVEYNKWNVQNYQISFDGIIKMLEEQTERRGDEVGEDLET
jgi:excinuclease ABC subunit A